MSDTIDRTAEDFESLSAKLAVLSATLTPGEASALEVLLDHASAHIVEVTGFEFAPPEPDEVSGFSFSIGGSLFAPIQSVSQYGSIAASYGGSSLFGGSAMVE